MSSGCASKANLLTPLLGAWIITSKGREYHGALAWPLQSSPRQGQLLWVLIPLARHGYAAVFFERQALLQILYDNLKSKELVLPRKRAVAITTTKSGILIRTEDGDTFAGDIVVGADGVHSVVRREMRRIASQLSPGYFPAEEQKSQSAVLTAAPAAGLTMPQSSMLL